MNLNTPLAALPGVGSSLSWKLTKLNLNTVWDLINHYPFRYDDFSQVSNAIEAQEGEKVTLTGEVWSIKNIYTRSRKIITQAIFNDGTIPITLTWFNSSWLIKQITTGDRIQISGKLTKYKNKFTIVAPVWENLARGAEDGVGRKDNSTLQPPTSLHTGRLVPVYPETMGLTSKWIRTKIDQVLPKVISEVKDPLPKRIKGKMLDLKTAINLIHFPGSWEDATKARDRLAFDELFYVQLATQKVRFEWQSKPTIEKLQIPNDKLQKFIEGLPFKLTVAQKRVVVEICDDLKKQNPMNRLVQGEVGSGKTVVAAIIAYLTYLNNLKTLYMAPTEILAFQHYSTFQRLLEPFGISVGIYTGSRKFTKNQEARNMKNGKKQKKHNSLFVSHDSSPDIIIGTHALLSDKLLTEDVGLIIIDEQQRFGVEQRSVLRSKAKVPHFLTMTATPIPRTVALTLYGDLDLSIIDELPKGRKPVKTYVVPGKKRTDAYKFIEKKIGGGDQVYIITPLIEQSETLTSAKAAKVEFERLKNFV
ncbi:ATP-dependent DNA helicase RecG, partial [Candidatus Daviesbacteria bacterium]|nr:ATP-dependent DNA helicase RecG [Candidatus Daviesbacteria bacterium]